MTQWRRNTGKYEGLTTRSTPWATSSLIPSGLPQKIDAHQQADPAKIAVQGSPTLPGTDTEGPAFQFRGVDLGLAAHQIPLAVEQRGGVVPFATCLRHQAGHHIGAEVTCGSSQFFLPRKREVFWKTDEIGVLSLAAAEKPLGLGPGSPGFPSAHPPEEAEIRMIFTIQITWTSARDKPA